MFSIRMVFFSKSRVYQRRVKTHFCQARNCKSNESTINNREIPWEIIIEIGTYKICESHVPNMVIKIGSNFGSNSRPQLLSQFIANALLVKLIKVKCWSGIRSLNRIICL